MEKERRAVFSVREQLWAEIDWILADDLTFNSPTLLFPPTLQFTQHTMDPDPDIAPEPLFRPAKRRKFIRRRPDDSSKTTAGDRIADSNENDGAQPALDEDDNTETTGVVRLRRPHTTRKGGIGFSATSRMGQDDGRQTALGAARELDKETVQDMRDRFTGNSGQAVDVDRHMYGSSLRCAVPGRCRLTR